MSYYLEQIDPQILALIGMALLTILIPLAVMIFNSKNEFRDLDKMVILKHIVQGKWFLIYLGLIFLPLVFLNLTLHFQCFGLILWFIGLILWILGIYFMIGILVKSYYWIKGDKFKLRFKYLNELKNSKKYNDLKTSWYSVWQTEITEIEYSRNEREFLKIFASTIDQLLKEKKGERTENLIYDLFDDFWKFMDRRYSILSYFMGFKKKDIVYEKEDITLFSKFLEWHFEAWRNDRKMIREKLENILRKIRDMMNKNIEEQVKNIVPLHFFGVEIYLRALKDHFVSKYNEGYKEYKFCICEFFVSIPLSFYDGPVDLRKYGLNRYCGLASSACNSEGIKRYKEYLQKKLNVKPEGVDKLLDPIMKMFE